MTEAEFWQIIADSRKSWNLDDLESSREQQVARLRRLFKPLSAGKLIAFERHFRRFHEAAYHWDIWAAAYEFAGGCSDDGFHYCRYWLISMGRDVYEAALQNPDSLVDVFSGLMEDKDIEFEDFGYICDDAFKAKTRRHMLAEEIFAPSEVASKPESHANKERPLLSEPKGTPYPKDIEGDEAEFARRMPRLHAWLKQREAEYEVAQENA